ERHVEAARDPVHVGLREGVGLRHVRGAPVLRVRLHVGDLAGLDGEGRDAGRVHQPHALAVLVGDLGGARVVALERHVEPGRRERRRRGRRQRLELDRRRAGARGLGGGRGGRRGRVVLLAGAQRKEGGGGEHRERSAGGQHGNRAYTTLRRLSTWAERS